jgi:hypothetical protein
MWSKLSRKARKTLAAALILAVGGQSTVLAQHHGNCAPHCQRFHCPPPLIHCMEGPPKIKIKRGCPRPICCPCDMPNWGYYQTCWTPWPWLPDWSHCPVPPPAAFVTPGERIIQEAPVPPVQLPRKLESKSGL